MVEFEKFALSDQFALVLRKKCFMELDNKVKIQDLKLKCF